ncbi:hypothetical protein SLEP1_g43121 [Rubroshorea leprosula]|uniref:Dehydrin n=1 Tax=Rubroshorea leprosula TaxID=152421 RepID=A0AAV5LBZ3_9ROSI|nr:hypothetical protein SLEP1_g43121 [Rubroshorea leprosula]
MFDFLKKKKDKDVAMADATRERSLPSRRNSTVQVAALARGEEEIGEDGVERNKKKALKEKLKEKISGHKEGAEHKDAPAPVENPEKKKGILDKIKEKLPDHHKNADEHLPDNEPKEKGILDKIS